jgi:hypothetical protein
MPDLVRHPAIINMDSGLRRNDNLNRNSLANKRATSEKNPVIASEARQSLNTNLTREDCFGVSRLAMTINNKDKVHPLPLTPSLREGGES